MTSTPPPPREGQRHTPEPYTLTDNSGGFTGRGWRVSGPAGFDVYSDHQLKMAEEVCRQMNQAHAAALRGLPSPATDVPRLIEAARDNGGEPSDDINPDTRTFPEVLEHLASLMADKKWLTHMAKPGSKSAEGWAILLRKKAEQLRAALPPEVRP